MDKMTKMGQTSATGSFQLFLGRMSSTIILAAGTIAVSLFISREENGLYAVALVPIMTILLFQDWGVGAALTRRIAQYRSANKEAELRGVINAGLTFEALTGLSLTALSILLANVISVALLQKPEVTLLVSIASISIFSTAIYTVIQNIFVGFEKMKFSAFTTFCQAIVQGAVAPALVLLGYGVFGAMIGYVLASVTACLISACLLYFAIYRKLIYDSSSKLSFSQTVKPLLSYGVPLGASAIVTGLLSQLFGFMTAPLPNALLGDLRVASQFAVLLTFFTIPISTVLFPAFSKLDPQNERHLLKSMYTSSVKYTALLLIPATMAMMVLAQPIIGTIFADKYPGAPAYLAIGIAGNLLVLFGNLSVTSLLSSLGETKLLAVMNLISLCIGATLGFVLVPHFQIYGVLISAIIAMVPSMFIGIYVIWKRYEIRADLMPSAKILLASFIATAATYLMLSVFHASYFLLLIVGALLFLVIYLGTAPLVGAINQTDVNNLRAMFAGLGIVSKVLEIPLSLMEKPLRMRTDVNTE